MRASIGHDRVIAFALPPGALLFIPLPPGRHSN